MKVLQINNFYKEGSTGKIVYDIHNSLKKRGIDSIVCYGRGTNYEKEDGVYRLCTNIHAKVNKFFASISGLMYGGCQISTWRLIRIIKKEKPDIVHLQCINGNFVNIYKLITYLKESCIKTVLTLHAEFMYTANCGHALNCDKWITGCGSCPRLKQETNSYFFDKTSISWEKMKEAFKDFNENLVVVSVSLWLQSRAEKSPILEGKEHVTILNGIDTENIFNMTESNLRNESKLENKKVVLHVTASFSSSLKGGRHIIELAERMPQIIFMVIGNTDKKIDLPDNIIDIGRIENQKELAEYYTMADLFVLASEREAFAMTVAESLCCGTPVVGFKAGAPEQIALKTHSSFAEFDDVDSLQKVIEKRLKEPYDRETISREAILQYNKENMINAYIDIYKDLV